MNNDIQSILTGNNAGLNPNMGGLNTAPIGTESMDLNVIAQRAYDAEMAKHQAEVDAAQAKYLQAQAAAQQAQVAAANLSSGNIQSVVTYNPEQVALLQQQALAQLQQQAKPQQSANTTTQKNPYPTAQEIHAAANPTPQAGWEKNITSINSMPKVGWEQGLGKRVVEIPGNVAQTGIVKNYTNYDYFYGKWSKGSAQRALSEQWAAAGKPSHRGIATYNNRYLVAVSPKFGTVGDNIDIVLDNGVTIPATIADAKGSDAKSEWGHTFGKAVDVIEWESMGGQSTINTEGWQGHKVSRIVNNTRA